MSTPLRNILTWRGAISGLRDAISAQVPTVDDNSMSLMNQLQKVNVGQDVQNVGGASNQMLNYYTLESYIFNASICLLALTTMMRENDKIRMWKQFTRTEIIVKGIVVFLLFLLAKNVESVF